MSSVDVIVLGATPNGLAAASELARKKKKVVVLDSASQVGGLGAGREIIPGFTTRGLLHDTSKVDPLLIKRLGLSARAPTPILSLEADGPGLLLHRDAAGSRGELSERLPDDLKGFEEWCSWRDRVVPPLAQMMKEGPFDIGLEAPLWPLLRAGVGIRRLGKKDMMELLRRAPGSAQDLVTEFVDSPLLQALLIAPGLRGTWMGPRSPSSAAVLLLHQSLVGQELPGGPSQLVDALHQDCLKFGVEVRVGQEVGKIRVENGDVVGVECGEDVVSCTSVLSSFGPRRTLLEHIDPRILNGRLAREAMNIRCRGSLASIAFALRDRPVFRSRPDFEVEKALWAESPTAQEKAWDAVKHRRLPSAPPLDIRVHKDEEGWVLHALVRSAPAALKGGWSPPQQRAFGELVQTILGDLIHDFEENVVGRDLLTPTDLAREYGLDGGHELHAELALDQLHAFRPSPKLASYATPIRGLWLGSSGSHPGGAVDGRAGLLASAALLAQG